MAMRPLGLPFLILWGSLACAQPAPKLIDAHLHYNGDPAFLKVLLAKLDSVDGLAFLLVDPKDLDGVKDAVKQHANRLVGFGEIHLDAPHLFRPIHPSPPPPFPGLSQ